tara:strand:+ start:271 stop:651 length:381 start_codon:yes stop_codon:yes gene_type:complete
MNILQHLSQQATVSLATQKKDGDLVLTPLWLAAYGDKLYMRTIKDSAKVLRIQNFSQVSLAPCTWEGLVTGQYYTAIARLMIYNDPLVQKAEIALQEKYGAERSKMTAMMAEQNKSLCYIEISLTN